LGNTLIGESPGRSLGWLNRYLTERTWRVIYSDGCFHSLGTRYCNVVG